MLACSTSVLWIKQSEIDPVLLAGLRLIVAAVLLTPVYLRDWRKHRTQLKRSHYTDPILPGVVLAVHFITWIIGARMTTAVNATLLVNLLPIAMPLMLVWLASEAINRRELAATGIAAVGMGLMFAADYRLSSEYFYGDLICVGSMLLLGLYLTLGRRYRHHPTVWLYVVPLYYYAAAASLAASGVLAKSLKVDWSREWPWVLALAVIPTIIGHSLINNAMRHLRGQIVALANMLQFVFAGVLAYYFPPHETPDWTFYPACVLLVIAGVIVVQRSGSGSRDSGLGKVVTHPCPEPETRNPNPEP